MKNPSEHQIYLDMEQSQTDIIHDRGVNPNSRTSAAEAYSLSGRRMAGVTSVWYEMYTTLVYVYQLRVCEVSCVCVVVVRLCVAGCL